MRHLFLLGGMALISAFASSQELRISNQRTAVADPNQKKVPESDENTSGTLIVRPVERAINAAEQSGMENGERNTNSSKQIAVNPMERATVPVAEENKGSGTQEKPKATVIKPE